MSNISYLVFQTCCGCNANLRNIFKNKNVRQVNEKSLARTRDYFKNHSIKTGDYLCNSCRFKLSNKNSQSKVSSASSLKTIISSTAITTSLSLTKTSSLPVTKADNGGVSSIVSDSIERQQQNTVKSIVLATANASHKHCILCKNSKGLRQIMPESILYAFSNHGIVIKPHSRCCDTHIGEDGRIKQNEFTSMQTTLKSHNEETIAVLEMSAKLCQKIEYRLQNFSGIFDKFKDMATLDEALCIKVTGWTKLQFNDFAKYITSVRDTSGRTKEQLIAIYRFWLSKGIDQCSLAMFKSKTSQQQISHYLAQIRVAMNKDFVPLFLGAKKGKQFFLEHNTDSVKALHQMNDKTLALICDGTYTRLEKSTNNDFQYASYSMQKQDNLIKPFIICCADGYFVDCYGPFQANANDAQILDHILKTDLDLKQLLTPCEEIVLFLDRGFRDNYTRLTDEGYNVQIPTCIQIEHSKELLKKTISNIANKKSKKIKRIQKGKKTKQKSIVMDDTESDTGTKKKKPKQKTGKKQKIKLKEKPLTTAQTGETRLVTKVRFIIEKQNSLLKNKKALDNIRNTQAGHILVDYRITCAMWNFTMKPCIPDGIDSVSIAENIRKLCNKKQNKLESLLNMRFTCTFNPVDINTINDFPKLTPYQMEKRIALGSYKIKQCPSYLGQMIEHGKAYILDSKQIDKYVTHQKVKDELQYSKILAVLLPSRHQRGKKNEERNKALMSLDAADPRTFSHVYKVFIQYVTNNSDEECKPYRLIKRFICSCFSGRQVAGCCVHVATVIFYFSYAKEMIRKDPLNIKLPADHLNSMLIDLKVLEPSNDPRYVKHKRRDSKYIEKIVGNDPLSPFNSDISSDDDVFEHKNIRIIPQKPCSVKYDRDNDKCIDKSCLIVSKRKNAPSRNSSQEINKKKNPLDKIAAVMKTSKTKSPNNISKAKKIKPLLVSESNEEDITLVSADDFIPSFKGHIPSWGGEFINQRGEKITVVNTCTIDYYLLCFWVMRVIMPNFHTLEKLEHTDAITSIIQNIDINDWNNARQIWYTEVMKQNIGEQQKIDFFGTVDDMFIKYMLNYQNHDIIQKCSNICAENSTTLIRENSGVIQLAKIRIRGVEVVTDMAHKCKKCHKRVTCDIIFRKNPLFIFVDTLSHLKINEMPKTLNLNKQTFQLFCAIFHLPSSAHFVSVFLVDDKMFLIDDLVKNEALFLTPNEMANNINFFKLNVVSALYILR